jgi:hypothetical protein
MTLTSWTTYVGYSLLGMYLTAVLINSFIQLKRWMEMQRRQKDADALHAQWAETQERIAKAMRETYSSGISLFSTAWDTSQLALYGKSKNNEGNNGTLVIERQAYQALHAAQTLWQRLHLMDDMRMANRYAIDESNYTIVVDHYGARMTKQDGLDSPVTVAFAPAISDKILYDDCTREDREMAWYALSGQLLNFLAWYAGQQHRHLTTD